MEPIFMHIFGNKEDIEREFSLPKGSLDSVTIHLAYYHVGSWGCDSSAFVLYSDKGKLYEVHGSHCSCHGLENQWYPDKVTIEELEHRLTKGSLGSVGGYDHSGYAAESKQVIEYLKQNGI